MLRADFSILIAAKNILFSCSNLCVEKTWVTIPE